MRKVLWIWFLLLGLTQVLYCGQINRIELNDGSVIKAEIISLQNGVYTLKSSGFGQINIPANKIRKIEAATSTDNTDLNSKVESFKKRMSTDPEVMGIVSSLISNPDFQRLSSDPDIVKAATSGDIQTLMSNEKFRKFLEDPQVKEAGEKLSTTPH